MHFCCGFSAGIAINKNGSQKYRVEVCSKQQMTFFWTWPLEILGRAVVVMQLSVYKTMHAVSLIIIVGKLGLHEKVNILNWSETTLPAVSGH